MEAQTRTLDYWVMKNLENSETEGIVSFSAWAEWDVITDSSDDDDD